MITYRCERDNIETKLSRCPHCGDRTTVSKSEVYWCSHCNIPLYEEQCPLCGEEAKRLTKDLRPVFPEERLLLELILKKPFAFLKSSVWNGSGNIYYVDGKRIPFTVGKLQQLDTVKLKKLYDSLSKENNNLYFQKTISLFCEANAVHYQDIQREAMDYIREMTRNSDLNDMFVSFSGGKDSTVTSDLVMRALSNPQILHIFGDTTLEFPHTMEYVKRFKKEHSRTIVISSRNKEKNFEELCQLLGPPSRVMRWCCTIFKTGAITRKITTLFKNKNKIITFYGIRRSESASRSKYDRESDSPKIAKQITISPIIDWMDFDVWLYLLASNLDFNDAYRLGYARVGCWCCPNNSGWSEFLAKIHMPEQAKQFRKMLIAFATEVGKPDPMEYVDSGNWKARQGGNGVSYAQKSVVSFEPCATEENTFNYELQRPISEDLYELFKPFGLLQKDIGNKRLNEVYIQNKKGEMVLKLQGKVGSTHLKVTILNYKIVRSKSMRTAEEKVKCQLTKYQMCMGCLGCEGVCKFGAIRIRELDNKSIEYKINEEQCTQCGDCVGHFVAGCYMRKVLAIKRK